jgi:hypothetical protein
VLCSLARSGFPAERPADADPVSMHEGQAVTVTEYVTGKTPPPTQATFRTLGDLLGRLHGLAPAPLPRLRRVGRGTTSPQAVPVTRSPPPPRCSTRPSPGSARVLTPGSRPCAPNWPTPTPARTFPRR